MPDLSNIPAAMVFELRQTALTVAERIFTSTPGKPANEIFVLADRLFDWLAQDVTGAAPSVFVSSKPTTGSGRKTA